MSEHSTIQRFPAGRTVTLLLALLLPAPAAPLAADDREAAADWTQWRGPGRDGSVPDRPAWPTDLTGLERRWRVPLGKGYPGPIVSADRIFVVETVDDETVAVRALDRATGKELWNHAWPGAGSVPFFAAANGDWVRSTPAFDGETLYVGDMGEVMLALDAASGKVRWKVDFPARFETEVPDFGFASSPLVDGQHLYVQAANSLVKLDSASGETVWRALNHSAAIRDSGAFSSPVIASIAGVRQLVVQTRHQLYGVALESGDVLWSHAVPNFRGMNILTPTVFGDAVFTSPYRQKSFLYRVTREDEGFGVAEAWTNKATAYMSSPIVIDGHAYLHLGNGRLECLDLAGGESRWRSEPLGKYWSMVHQGASILGLAQDGTLHLVRADPERFRLLDSREVAGQETWGHLAVSGDMVFVRELEAVTAWRWRASGPEEEAAAAAQE